MDKKTVLIVGGLAAVGAVAFFMLRKKDEEARKGELPPGMRPGQLVSASEVRPGAIRAADLLVG